MAGHRVVIVGGGFGGLYAARELGRDPRLSVTLVDRRNYHLFQPLLYQVATGALAPGEIAQPLRSILRRDANTTVLLGEAVGIDPERRQVLLSDGGPVAYDTLIVASGARFSYFGHDDWAPNAPGLKSIDDATEIRRRILIAFEAAEREHDRERRAEWMTFVVVGGGPTGVELAGALGEIAHDTLRRDFRAIHPPDARIVLIEALDRILPTYPPDRSRSAKRQLERLGVVVRTGTRVVHVDDRCVRVEAAGVRGAWSPPGPSCGRPASWPRASARPSAGRPGPRWTGPGGSSSARTCRSRATRRSSSSATRRSRRGSRAGRCRASPRAGSRVAATRRRPIRRRLSGEPTPPFRYRDKGDVAVIGRLAGVTNIGWLGPFGRQGGFTAWLLWLGIHIFYLIGFANRIVVIVRWAWSFFTHGRGSRLITGSPLLPPIEEPEPPTHPDRA